MPTISSTLKMFDAMSGPLKSIMSSMNLVIRTFEQMQTTTERSTNISKTLTVAKQQIASAEAQIRWQIEQANKAQQRLNRSEAETRNHIEQANRAQQRFNRSLQQGLNDSQALVNSIKGMAAAYLSIQGARSVANLTDEYVNTRARLDLINDGLQTTAELQQEIFAAADRARGVYSDMAGVIGRLGVLAGGAFRSNDELIAFAELMQKSFRISGASTMEQQAGMYQLAQAMAAGRLQGDEFRSIMENAPMLAQAIARFTGKSMGELKEMSAEGTITADIIKGAMFAAADDINRKFASMPRTFGDYFAQIKNSALREFGPAIEQISRMLNSEEGAQFADTISAGFAAAARMTIYLMSGVINLTNTIRNNWGIIEPILYAIAFVYLAKTVTGIWQMAAAWMIANWYVLLIVGALALLIYLLDQMGVTSDQVVGYVAGVFNMLFTFIYNQVAALWNGIARFAEFFVNVWHHPIYSVKKLFVDFVSSVLEHIKRVAEALDWVFGSNLADHITSLQENMKDWLGEMPEGYKVIQRLEEKSLVDAFRTGYKSGANFVGGIEDAIARFNAGKMFGDPGFVPNIGNIAKVGEVGKIRDTVDISSEDLKMMRELAEMKSIQNFVSLRPSVRVQTGPISKEVDIETVIARIEEALTEQIASSAQGVYGVG